MDDEKSKLTYRDAGVDIDAANRAVELIKRDIKTTCRQGVVGDIGGFGGLFALDTAKYTNPILVSGTDGVGTKLKIAFMMNKHNTIGQDAVAMCVNDILTLGAEPLFFLDYLAVGKLEEEKVAAIVSGVAAGCREAGCALIGGETAEMAGFYPHGEYDLAGFAVGAVNVDKVIAGEKTIRQGDFLIGLKSSGLHSNGYSLARKICFDVKKMSVDLYIDDLGRNLGEELLEPTRIYVKTCLPLLGKFDVHGLIHITGGGFYDNIPRILPQGCGVNIDTGAWAPPPIFSLLQKWGGVDKSEMYRTFNMGIGMILIVPAKDAGDIIKDLAGRGETGFLIGEVTAGSGVSLK